MARKMFAKLVPRWVKSPVLSYFYWREKVKSEGWYKYYCWGWKISIEKPWQIIKRKRVFELQEKKGLSNIPIFLISFNRLSHLQAAITRLEEMGLKNIIIIDNASSYQPLLEYYKTIPYKVLYMKKNYGHRVFWKCAELEQYRENFYIISDPDVIPIEECPNDLIKRMFDVLKNYPNITKVGLSLKIDDLPEDGILTGDVLRYEQQYNEKYIKKNNLYIAPVDTTFALYSPQSIANKKMTFYCGLRIGYPYQARHLPWYKRKEDITEEDRFYSELNRYGTYDIVNSENKHLSKGK